MNYEYSKWGYKSFEPNREERSCEMLLFALRRCMIRHTADAVLRLPPRTDELVPGARSHTAHTTHTHTHIYIYIYIYSHSQLRRTQWRCRRASGRSTCAATRRPTVSDTCSLPLSNP